MRYATLVATSLTYLIASSVGNLAIAQTSTSKVMSVTDGDSIKIMQDGKARSLIFFGIDAPELGQEAGQEARNFVDERCFGKTVTIEEHGKDSHGRIIAIVYLPDGSNLNQEMVKQGLAWWSDKYAPNDSTLKQLQATAKASHKGLWGGAKPIPPWLFRNGEKSVQAVIKPSATADSIKD